MMAPMTAPPEHAPADVSVDGRAQREGTGLVRVERVNGRSVVVRDRAGNPLKLLCPDRPGDAAWVYTSGYGGGLVAGDSIGLDFSVGAGSTAALTTQASTKVYHRQQDRGARQRLNAEIEDGALLAVLPDPLVCYADAIYDQTQVFDLRSRAGLIMLDWLTAGRREMAHSDPGTVERWAFAHYRSRNVIRVDGRVVAIDDVTLDGSDGPIASAHRVGRFNCLANVFLAGPATETMQRAMDALVSGTPIVADEPTVVAYSQMPWGGVLRIGGASAERVASEIRRHLEGLDQLLGVCPWTRKW